MTVKSRHVTIAGTHVTLFNYGVNQWSFTVYHRTQTVSQHHRDTYVKCLRSARGLVKILNSL